MRVLTSGFAMVALLLAGAIFGFFYAWVCSTMWGLDALPPNTAIAAMQAMNASVRNAVFMPAFFLTPVALLATAALAWLTRQRGAALAFGLGGLVYLFGGLILTATINVPMNEALAEVQLPLGGAEAAQVWADYSPEWQYWNTMRTNASGIALLLAGVGVWLLGRGANVPSRT